MKFKLRRYYLYYLGRSAAFVFTLMPMRIGCAAGRFLGRIAYLVLPKYRVVALDNLRAAFSDGKTDAQIRSIAKESFENLGAVAAEIINFPKINAGNIDRIVRIVHKERLEAAFKEGKGVIILTGHFGNWELLAMYFRVKGYPGVAIGRRIYFHKFDNYLNSLRKIHDVNIIYRDESPKKMLRVLKSNHILGVLADQDVDSVEGVFVDFFGQPAYTPVGPVAIAKASGAALVPTFLIRKGHYHEFILEEPIELVDTGNKENDALVNTKRWSDIFEGYIRRYPGQWVWMHRRWKTKQE